jgi:hypothetical protein
MDDGGIHVTPSPASLERRLRYLERVGDHLQMPAAHRDDVLEEIAAHLEDTIGALMAEGLTIEQAEREAMARLGSPDELGNELRRTHRTTKRLLAAVGGGVWRGLEGAITGYVMALAILIPVFLGLLALVQAARTIQPHLDLQIESFAGAMPVPGIICVAVWLAGRWMVRSIAHRSWRREHTVRRQVAAAGFVLLAAAVMLLPADYSWLSVVLTLAIPFAFAAGAISAGGRADERPWVDVRWPARLPSRRKLLWGSVVGLVIVPTLWAIVAYAVGGPQISTGFRRWDSPTQEWADRGFAAVARLRPAAGHWFSGSRMPIDGWALVELPTDTIDWDAWPGLRVEAWRATSPYDGSDDQALLDPASGPYLVVPLDDPWGHPRVPVKVGQPGVNGYLLFLVAQDPVTGIRTAFGRPDGYGTQFHGTLIDWFAAQ